jgi:hypothetical protein
MPFSDEELIAYLLGDASPELSLRIQQQLQIEPELLGRLSEFRRLLEQIDSIGCPFEPPADLVDTTLARIDALEGGTGEEAGGVSRLGESSDEGEEFGEVSRLGESSDEGVRVLLRASIDAQPRRSSWWDSTALTISLTILCCLALPALVRIRFESRKTQCARNLSLTGSELIGFALSDPQQRFPRVALEGREAFAGYYAIALRDAGAPLSPSQLRCASLIGTPFDDLSQAELLPYSRSIPTADELQRIALHELALWQQSIGGDYAYNLGVAEQGNIQAPKCQGSSHFAILADAPVIIDQQSDQQHDDQHVVSEQFIAHDGRGINVFYEDGRVVFVTTNSLHRTSFSDGQVADNPMNNQHGVHEVGLHSQDASLAPSHFPPLSR